MVCDFCASDGPLMVHHTKGGVVGRWNVCLPCAIVYGAADRVWRDGDGLSVEMEGEVCSVTEDEMAGWRKEVRLKVERWLDDHR